MLTDDLPTTVAAAPPPRAAVADESRDFALDLELRDGYEQHADFGLAGVPPLVVDEPAPLGAGAGPNPARLLAAALASCLGASLLFCLRRGRVDVRGLRTHAEGTIARNESGRLRVAGIRVRLEPEIPAEQHARAVRCLAVFEDYCVVTAAVRASIPVEVDVVPVDPAAAG